MEGPFRLMLDEGPSCVAVAAVVRIRQIATKQRDDGVVNADNNLLPDPSALREILGTSICTISDLLKCPCTLCKPHGKRSNPGWDKSIERSLEKDGGINALTVLLLSGCLFALRDFNDHDSEEGGTLSSFLDRLEKANTLGPVFDGDDPRARLLRPLGLEIDLEAATDIFLRAVRSKLWLVRIPFFRPKGQLVKFMEKQNMPFLGERAIPGLGVRLNKKYVSFRLAEGYTVPELGGRELFAKQFTFHRSVIPTTGREAREEVANLDLINGLKHPNIAKMLFAFEEQHADPHRLSIVFKRYEHDLHSLLHKGGKELLKHFHADSAVLPVDHGLWKAMLGIVDAVNALHNPAQPRDSNVIHAGHFDIKPANILMDLSHTPARLLLTDFGRAHVRQDPIDQTSGFSGGAATDDYAPPEFLPVDSSAPVARLRRSYDIWSLGCVLLETLGYIENPMNDFHSRRQEQSADHSEQNAAFWVAVKSGAKLKDEVHGRIMSLLDSREIRLQNVGLCLRKMLEIDARERAKQSIQICLQELRPTAPPEPPYSFPGMRALMESLALKSTYCAQYGKSGTFPCRLFVLRHVTPSIDDVVRLVIELPHSRTAEKQFSPVGSETLIPIAFFGNLDTSRDWSSPALPMQCAFSSLHAEFDLFFTERQDYLRFFWLMTHQQIMRGDVTDWGLNITIGECQLKPSNYPIGRRRHFGGGRAQLWITCDEEKYDDVFVRKSHLLSPGPAHQRRRSGEMSDSGQSSSTEPHHLHGGKHNGHKLVLFISNSNTGIGLAPAERACIIFELDRNDIQFDEKLSVGQIVSFKSGPKRSSFPVLIIQPLVGVSPLAKGNVTQYPGIPLAWDLLNKQIQNSETRVRELMITLPSVEEGKNLRRLLAQYGPY